MKSGRGTTLHGATYNEDWTDVRAGSLRSSVDVDL
jgi:hypothetical protein